MQLCTLRFLGTFLTDPSRVPETAVQHVAQQLGIRQIDLKVYAANEDSKLRHQARIRTHLGYREFDAVAQFGMARLLLSRLTIAENRLAPLIRTGLSTLGYTLEDFSRPRRLATLLLGDDNNRARYTVCAMLQLHTGLTRGDIFVIDSNAHRDPRAQLLEGDAWMRVRNDVLRSLDLPSTPKAMISRLSKALHAKYKGVQRQLRSDPTLELREENGVLVPYHKPFDALPEPETLVWMNREVNARLAEIDLAKILLEMNARTHFLDEMLRGADGRLTASNLAVSLAAVLLAETCNIGLKAVSRETDPALTSVRLEYVKKTFLNKHANTRGNARLVEFHTNLALTKRWGTVRWPVPRGCVSWCR